MYSVVMMMALSGSADLPAFGHRRGCHRCDGGCSASCSGWSDCGGGCHGGRHHGRRHGCHGGYGCSGGYACCGSYGGGYGGCWGGGMMGCTGGYMDGHMAPPPHDGAKPMPRERTPGTDRDRRDRGDTGRDEASLNAPATLVVSLPAEAKLVIDDYVTKSTSSLRTFTSPALQSGKEYVYALKAELVRGGQAVTTTKQITVRAGEVVNVALDFPAERVAAK